MEVIYKPTKPQSYTFGDVSTDQFFVDKEGYLCQKVNGACYNIIANDRGNPLSCHKERILPSTPVKRILPEVEQIKF